MVHVMKQMVLFAALLTVTFAVAAAAAIPNTSDYLHRTTPMISGSVFSVDDRQIVVDTDQEQRVTLVMDSRTMLPVDLAPGMMVRTEFRVMENGQYYANRITPIRDRTDTRQADAATGPRDRDPQLYRSGASSAFGRTADEAFDRAESAPVAAEPMAVNAIEPEAAEVAAEPETLPQTASAQPLLVLLGLLAFAGAGMLAITRRRANVR
jgi:LPXTG-motif cell wall-anchored protein